MKTVTATKMKCAVVSTFISLAFVSQAFAVLRPLFPVKPAAPFNGELIVIGDDLALRSAKEPLMHHRARHSSQCLDSRLWPLSQGLSLASATLSRRSPRTRDAASKKTAL